MARTSNNGGAGKTAKTPARRRTDKTRQPAAAASDSATTRTPELSVSESNGTLNPAEVQRRAFELYVQRGCCDGHDKDDWYEAERQLLQRQH